MRYIPQVAIDFISNAEGCKFRPYKDSGGLWTIGIGHLIKPTEKFGIITLEEAHNLLKSDMQIAAAAVARLITRPLNDNQYAALLSFTYNEGGGILQRSTLRRKCNRGDDGDVPDEFRKYVYARHPATNIMSKVTGLIHRREAEARLYMV